jgi:hypothetical protein
MHCSITDWDTSMLMETIGDLLTSYLFILVSS